MAETNLDAVPPSKVGSSEEDSEGYEGNSLSIIEHFKDLIIDPNTTVDEANKRRTLSYYEKSREAHCKELIEGVGELSRLNSLREKEDKNILRFHTEGSKSHRAVVCMCDSTTQKVLSEAREKILAPLQYETNASTEGVYIPKLNIIPDQDMHVTVAIPSWWHKMGDKDQNKELSKDMAYRLRQTILLKNHYPFQIELQRVVLLGGTALVALWRCVGKRMTEDGFTIYDRHGTGVDPFVRLREEIVRCFTTESSDGKRQPLTHAHKKNTASQNQFHELQEVPPQNEPLARQYSIRLKSPGLGQGDGFIHTTLCRLPLACLSQKDVDLGPIHRLCREASFTFSGHRMVVSKFRFLETIGAGGDSNPCVDPIYDEIIEAPSRFKVDIDGAVTESNKKILSPTFPSRNMSIGVVRDVKQEKRDLTKVFDAPKDSTVSGIK